MKQPSPAVWSHFQEFISGFTAARELYVRAAELGAFVECVCLGASLVDATLRIGLVLQYQLDHKTRDIPTDLVFQGPKDKAMSEREIYRKALAAKVINDSAFTRLQDLYDERNRVIHRYVISRISTVEVLDIAVGYEHILESLSKRIHEIEEQQIESGVGITVRGPALKGQEGKRFLEQLATTKHTAALAKLLREK